MTRTQQVIKRAIDVVVSGSALVVLLPLLPFVALFIKLESPGPVFYVARRYGQNRRPFDFYKLRTMVPDADRLGSLILTKAGDERVTRVGRILRAFKIDELPQLLNVLKGDMSIVGPRPEVFEVVENHYRDSGREFCRCALASRVCSRWRCTRSSRSVTPASRIRSGTTSSRICH